MGEFVNGTANVVGDTSVFIVTFVSQSELSSTQRQEFAEGIKSLAEDFDCIAEITIKNFP